MIVALLVTRFPDGGDYHLSDGRILYQYCKEIAALRQQPNVVFCRREYATGSGLGIWRYVDGVEEDWFLPLEVTRGARDSTSEELAHAPDWARAAYEWVTREKE